jgi:hypothetical protein
MATAQEILDSIAPIEANRQKSLDRAAEWRAKGREDRAETWDASAARYANLIEIKKRLAQSAENIAAIKARVTAIPKVQPKAFLEAHQSLQHLQLLLQVIVELPSSSGTPSRVLQRHLVLLILLHLHHHHHHLLHLHPQLKQHQ